MKKKWLPLLTIAMLLNSISLPVWALDDSVVSEVGNDTSSVTTDPALPSDTSLPTTTQSTTVSQNPTTSLPTTTYSDSSTASTTVSTPEEPTVTPADEEPAAPKENVNLIPATVAIQNFNPKNSRFNVQALGGNLPIQSAKVAIWTVEKGQDDITWLTMDVKQHQANLAIDIFDLPNYKVNGSYTVHVYVTYANGKTIGSNLGNLQFAIPEISSSIVALSASTFKINITNVPLAISQVKIPVWSKKNGQDDLKWYTASSKGNGVWELIVDTKHHQSTTGRYEADVYGISGKTLKQSYLLTTQGFDYNAKPSSKLSFNLLSPKEPSNTFEVSITGDANTEELLSVQLAVWSEDKGQDDLKWYTVPLKQNKGKAVIDIRKHGNVSGKYIVHAYTNYSTGREGVNLGIVTIQKPVEKQLVTTDWTNTGLQVQVTSSGITDYKSIKIAIWSDDKGQDDLKWYTASNKGTVVVPHSSLVGFGKYHIHVYQERDKTMHGVTTTTIERSKPRFTSKITKVSEAQYAIEIAGLPSYITSVQIPVWSENKGQDDLKWYTAQKQPNGTYKLTLQLLDHNFDSGKYQAHVYVKTAVQSTSLGLGATEGFTVTQIKEPSGKVAISNVNHQTGSFDVMVSDIISPKGLKSVKVPIWSTTNGQDDLRWYTAVKQANGTYKVSVLAANHKYTSGEYKVDVYYELSDGKMVYITQTATSLKLGSHTGQISLSPVRSSDYTFTTKISNVAAVAGIKNVRVAVWAEAEGQNDLRWYPATKEKDGTYTVLVRLANHYYSNGKYQVHVYYDLNNGKTVGLGATNLTVTTPAPRAYVRQELQNILNQFHSIFAGVGGQKSVYITATDGVETVSYNHDNVQRAASTIKLFIMAAAFAKAQRGELNLNAPYVVKASDIVKASVSLGNAAGKTYTLADINRFMVETSDNTATNIMMRQIGGVEAVNREIRRMGYTKTYLQRYMHDQVAIDQGLDNYISAQEAGDLIRNMYNRTMINRNLSNQMVHNLSNNYYPLWLPASIRGQAYVIDKPGNNGAFGVENDVAIISKNGRTYSVTVLTQGTGSNGLSLTSRFSRFGQSIVNIMNR